VDTSIPDIPGIQLTLLRARRTRPNLRRIVVHSRRRRGSRFVVCFEDPDAPVEACSEALIWTDADSREVPEEGRYYGRAFRALTVHWAVIEPSGRPCQEILQIQNLQNVLTCSKTAKNEGQSECLTASDPTGLMGSLRMSDQRANVTDELEVLRDLTCIGYRAPADDQTAVFRKPPRCLHLTADPVR